MVFRDPERHTPEDPNLVISSADGKVCLIDEACPPEELLIENEKDEAHLRIYECI